MMRYFRAVACAAVLTWFAPGCGPGGGETGAPGTEKPVFKPRPGEAAKKEFITKLLQKKGMMPVTKDGTKK
jgi:hypothetical protein